MRNKNSYYSFALLIMILALNFSSCNSTSDKDKIKYDVISKKSFGITNVIYCLISDTNDMKLKIVGEKLCEKGVITYVFFYADKKNIPDLNLFTEIYDAIPKEGFNAEYSSNNGLIRFY